MSIFKSGLNAIGRLLIVAALAVAFFFGLVGVVYMSLQGHVIQVPDVTGKSFAESEKELSDLGLKIQRRADRASRRDSKNGPDDLCCRQQAGTRG